MQAEKQLQIVLCESFDFNPVTEIDHFVFGWKIHFNTRSNSSGHSVAPHPPKVSTFECRIQEAPPLPIKG